MNAIFQSIAQIFRGTAKALQTFPVTIACAFGFAVVTMVRIQLDWPQQEPYNFVFNCWHWAFAMGAIFSLAVSTWAKSRFNDMKSELVADGLGVLSVIATFFALLQFGGTDPALTGARYAVVTGLAAARVGVAMLVSFAAFIVLAGYPKDQSDFSQSFFMTHKAFFIASIYGAVMTSGASGVAGAVQALLYREMSSKVYMYIATLTGFIAFTIFVGYFPDFRKGKVDERRPMVQNQPRFIMILLDYIMIPLMLALTVVLLIWAGKTVLEGMGSSFLRLSSIASSYAVGGIWLHTMVTQHESGLAKFYRRSYPFAALVILAFEAWALVIQLGKSGLKMTEYSFVLIWIAAVAAVVLLIMIKAKAHPVIVVLVCTLAVISVLPAVGYHALPVTSQVNRLEKLLVQEGILSGDQLAPAATAPESTVREAITDAVEYLAYARDAKLPAWFDPRLRENEVFRTRLGFEKTWPKPEEPGAGPAMGTYLYLPAEAIDIMDYDWAVNMMGGYGKEQEYVTIQGDRGVYRIYWTMPGGQGIPLLKIFLGEQVILEQDMNPYIDQIAAKYPPGQGFSDQADLKDMSLRLETPEVAVLLVFSNIDINIDPQEDVINYWLNLNALYLKEKE